MTIDLSNLSQEKRAFLKVNPDLLKSLEQTIPKQAARVQTRQKKLSKGKSKLQRELEEIDGKVAEAKRKAGEFKRDYMLNRHLREINEKYNNRHGVSRGSKGLVCPLCGEPNGAYTKGKPNKINGKPACLKCNVPLIRKDKVVKWLKLPRVKVPRDGLSEFKRRRLDF